MPEHVGETLDVVASGARHTRSRLPEVDLLYVDDVALFYGVSPAAIRKRIRLGRLGAWMKSGARYAIRATTFERFLEGQEGKQEY